MTCNHTLIQDEGDRRRCFACGKEWKKPNHDVIGDLDCVRDCYGHYYGRIAPEPEVCEVCPVQLSCTQLTDYCRGVKA